MIRTIHKLFYPLLAIAALALAACEEDIEEAQPSEENDTLAVTADIPAPVV